MHINDRCHCYPQQDSGRRSRPQTCLRLTRKELYKLKSIIQMKEIDKYIVEKKSEKILAKEHVTTMSYDLEVKDDTNINQEIKDYLIGKEWNFTIPERRVIPYLGKERTEKDADTPHTTAWKEGVTPKEAINEFCAAIDAYNTNHALDTPVKLGRGNAFAVKDNEYDAIKIG